MCVCVCMSVFILRVPNQNGVSLLHMLEIHHSGQESSNYVCVCISRHL